MDPLQREITLPNSRFELQSKSKIEVINLFFHVFQMPEPPVKIAKWLIKEVQSLARRNKLSQKIALLMVKVIGPAAFAKKQENFFTLCNKTNGITLNKLLLTSSSGFFRSASNYRNCEFTTDCSDSVFDQLCAFFRLGTIPEPNIDDLMQLYAIAQEYQIDNLIDFCHSKVAELIGGIEFHRLPNDQIVLQIDSITKNFENSFPFIQSSTRRIDLLEFIYCFKINGRALEEHNSVLTDLIMHYSLAKISVNLSTASLHSAIPELLKWSDEALNRIATLKVETHAVPSNFDSLSNTSKLLLKLFERCTQVVSCHLSTSHVQSDALIKKVLASMPNLQELEIESPITEEAFVNFPSDSQLKTLTIRFPLTRFPLKITQAKELQKLSFGPLALFTIEDMVALTRLPNLRILKLKNLLNEECLAQLLQHPSRTETASSICEELSLPAEGLTSECFQMLADSYLKKLHLTKAHDLTDDNLKVLSAMRCLKSFSIEEAFVITNEGVKHFVVELMLKELTIKNCPQLSGDVFDSPFAIKKVTLNQFPQLVNLKVLGEVKHLRLLNCKNVTDRALASLYSFTTKKLTIYKCGVSQIGIQNLVHQLPGLKRLVYQPSIEFHSRELIKNRL